MMIETLATVGLLLIVALIATVIWAGCQMRWLREAINRRRAVLVALLVPLSAQAQPKDQIKRLPNAAEAADMAYLDLKSLSVYEQPYYRYVWISDFTVEKAKAVTLGINYPSRASVPTRLTPLLDGSILRVDLRKLAPRNADLEEWMANWELLRFDPTFNLLITKDMFAHVAALKTQPVCRVREDGRFRSVPFGKLNLKDVDVVRITGPHLNDESIYGLQDLTGSAAPIVEARYFLQRTLTTIQDKGLWNTLYAGIYYELAGTPESKDGRSTDEDLLFRQLGVGSEKETADQVFDRLRSDQRIAVFRRTLNGKPTRVDFIPTLSRRLGDGVSFLSITHDVKDESIDVGQHPIMNLAKFKDDAREAIFTRASGMPGYVLYDGKGKLQRFVPPDVAADRGIPAPHQPILQGAISCIHCHEAGGSDGWQPVSNDVRTLLAEVDVFAELSQGNKPLADALDRLAGQYLGSPAKLLQRARDDYAATVLAVTGSWKGSKTQTDVVKLAAKELVGMVYQYRYDAIDAQQALKEWGLHVPKDQARVTIKNLLPPAQETLLGFVPEDPRIAALKAGLSINRAEFDLIKSMGAYRIKKTLETLPK